MPTRRSCCTGKERQQWETLGGTAIELRCTGMLQGFPYTGSDLSVVDQR
jgi:hypothetical protein